MAQQFKKHVKKKTKDIYNHKIFRFIISGGLATFVDIFTYFICLHFFFQSTGVQLCYITITAPIASLITSFSAGFITSFTINKLFVFKGSAMRTRHQLTRFTGVAALVFVLNYALMKFLLEVMHLYPTVSRIIASGTIATLSFVMHNVFTFKTRGVKPKAV